MGRNNKKNKYKKTMHQQAFDLLSSKCAFGESKKESIINGTQEDKIFSFSTYKSYKKVTKAFLKWMAENHPEIQHLKKCRPFVKEYLQSRSEHLKTDGSHLSAWTLHLDTCALGKLFGISADDPERFQPPKRERKNIQRSRLQRDYDKHFSLTNNDELIRFIRGTGLRRAGLQSIRGKDLFSKAQVEKEIARIESIPESQRSELEAKHLKAALDVRMFTKSDWFILVKEKGGRYRFAPVVGEDTERIVNRFMERAPEDKVWEYVHRAASTHKFRADYARTVYMQYRIPIDQIPYDRVNRGTGRRYQSGVYICRSDESGKKLCRNGLLHSSLALGHNRIDTTVSNYIRNL